MPQSLSLAIVHVIFGTKDRVTFITPEIRVELHAYLATIARHGDGNAIVWAGSRIMCIWRSVFPARQASRTW